MSDEAEKRSLESEASIPIKKRARLTHSTSSQRHAHFDCFSGAAGDMLLASCLDASEDPGHLAERVVHAIKLGLPELAEEFHLSYEKAWRGAGSIYAMTVKIESVYKHQAVPVPSKNFANDREACISDAVVGIDDEITHNHSHSPGHSHRHSQDHPHDHSLEHNHGHSHGHSHVNDTSLIQSEALDKGVSRSEHDHHQSLQTTGPLRNLPEIRRMLENAPEEHIPLWVKNTAIEAFVELAKAEASVHGASGIDTVHFHEVGAVDSIVDTVGTLLALHFLGAKTFSMSPLPMGEGAVRTAHGILPVPAPATLHLMVGMRTAPGPPGVTGELVTPTAAAILRVLTNNTTGVATDRPPRFTLRRIGLGAGTKDFRGHPNIMRLFLGDDVLS
ncbi:uncharacterized protein FisN_10Lh264 [Fistulifera solaris]|uniref:LarC family nickel insertion protein n=1 Tax=Fistulifera solaris TaxID=1519565 RepID=A0A1Z5KGG9_FISSO|nr:uncharacterized protein FisN_10Lh264 [Fistulifera solaris]|eukprot:GAX25068.1 uncharacterized protein FisN_10Lh264 [Fistulifera solaris]